MPRISTYPLCLFAALHGCRGVPSQQQMPTVRVEHAGLGLSVEVPTTWTVEREDRRMLVSGQPHSPEFVTTLTAQAIWPDFLDHALEQSYRALSEQTKFEWLWREPILVQDYSALFYCAAFELHELPRRRCGVLVHRETHLVDLAYQAPDASFTVGLPRFLHALESIEWFGTTLL